MNNNGNRSATTLKNILIGVAIFFGLLSVLLLGLVPGRTGKKRDDHC